jgi:hypothetical protein
MRPKRGGSGGDEVRAAPGVMTRERKKRLAPGVTTRGGRGLRE